MVINIKGRGIIYYTDGSKYGREWKNCKKNGQGIMCYAHGDKYEG